MTPDIAAALRAEIDAEGPRLPLVTAGEARAAVALLAHYGQGDGEAAYTARCWAAAVARRLAAE
ncbi:MULTISPECIES: hypothetical protein [Streptomyces]|uniref:hypothetical protein n=1 Tax=Streptomyces TaxID=1883 RepID=UPI0004CDA502|nr:MULTISPECIES: hypothetical protein [Streptomyces]KOT49931.1 hypothetical protein ADK43_35025 [Streptomyces rimosus subsp. rimosus]